MGTDYSGRGHSSTAAVSLQRLLVSMILQVIDDIEGLVKPAYSTAVLDPQTGNRAPAAPFD